MEKNVASSAVTIALELAASPTDIATAPVTLVIREKNVLTVRIYFINGKLCFISYLLQNHELSSILIFGHSLVPMVISSAVNKNTEKVSKLVVIYIIYVIFMTRSIAFGYSH